MPGLSCSRRALPPLLSRCNRWSDGDGGCSTCQGTGRMICSSCRGGGTAVPIQAKVYIDNQRTSNFRQNH